MSEWISVNDRLPDETGYYLVTFPWYGVYSQGNCRVMHFLKMAYETPVNSWYEPSLRSAITHWMPLPAAPEVKP